MKILKSKKNKLNSNGFLTERYANIGASSISKINGKDSPMNKIEGCHSKEFVRMAGDYFQDLYEELRNNPNSSYRTYMNDVIRSGYDPKHLSVLVKLVDQHISRCIYRSFVITYTQFYGSTYCL